MNELSDGRPTRLTVPVNYVENAARMRACLEWIVRHDGECLGDHPKQLAIFEDVLAQAKALRGA